jgi:hypothetical protein
VVSLALPLTAAARQLTYSQESSKTALHLAYRFETPRTRQPLTFSFALSKDAVHASRGAFRRFNPRDLERQWTRERARVLQQEVQHLHQNFPNASFRLQSNGRISYKSSPMRANEQLKKARARDIDALILELRHRYPHILITYQARSNRVQMSGMRSVAEQREVNSVLNARMRALEARAKRLYARIATQRKNESRRLSTRINNAIERTYSKFDDFKKEYLEARYYTFNRSKKIQVDYGRIARESLPDIKPLASAWARQHALPPSRKALNQLLGFFQSIPYSTLERRNSSDEAGFAVPVALLSRNRGDCDTKSVGMAAMVHALAPDIPIIMVLTKDHALLGFAIEPARGDETLEFNGRTYVLAEPVGPALTRLGKIHEHSRSSAQQVLQLFEPAALRRG